MLSLIIGSDTERNMVSKSLQFKPEGHSLLI